MFSIFILQEFNVKIGIKYPSPFVLVCVTLTLKVLPMSASVGFLPMALPILLPVLL